MSQFFSTPSRRPGRLLGLALVATVTVTSGCGWFGGNKKAAYESSSESRPLELPPDLDMPQANSEMVIPQVRPGRTGNSPAPVPSAPPAAGPQAAAVAGVASAGISEFTLEDQIENAFRRISLALGRTEGVNVASSSQLLGSFEVQYQGQDFLIRIQPEGSSSRVSAVAPDGRALTAGPATELLAQLKQRLG